MQRRKEAMRKANEYLNVADMFKLGALQTEQSHPRTRHLSDWAKKDIQKAIAVIKEIDQAVLDLVARKSVEIELLASDIEHTLAEGGRIFLSGCGATGRLALTLERIWRELDSFEDGGPDDERVDSVLAFMAGGDLALVKAIEDFEDHPEYGVAQLKELGFGSGDLLLAITEGGETPFVLGTVEEAAKVAERMPYLLYCNPDEVLRATVERSKRVIDNPRIKKLNLTTGPQVLSGSTRMQASTVQMLSVGLALFRKHHGFDIAPRARDFTRWFRSLDLSFLEKFIRREAEIYKQGEFLLYRTREYGMAVVTDTTERSPTFSLAPFENFDDPSPTRSWAYLSIPGTSNSEEAWYHLLLRPPRTLEWQQVRHIAGRQRLLGYDFSDQAKDGRGQLREHTFDIYKRDSRLCLELDELYHEIDIKGFSPLEEYTLLKILLNTHSTLVMGRLGRYEGNVMLWVKPSNYKLIDRTSRYVLGLLERDGITTVSYDRVVQEVFLQMEQSGVDESVVWKSYTSLKSSGRKTVS